MVCSLFAHREVQGTAAALNNLITSFKFFPIFLLTGYLAYATNRWEIWAGTVHARSCE